MTIRFCTTCGQRIETGSSCPQCGVAGHRVCPACRSVNPRDSRFCAGCGAAQILPEQRIETRRPSATAIADENLSERREVTVIFVDATDFTATSHRLDAEDVYIFINDAMKLLADVVAEYEGTVDKYTGDGLMALFGAPIAHENDAERAVRTAWDMQRVLKPLRARLQAQHGVDFRIRIGVHTGDVITGTIGSNVHAEYTAIGDTVNLAARLQTAAEPGAVFVSAATHDRTAINFRYEELPPLTLKGISEPIRAYRVAGLRQHLGPHRGLPGITVPLIGREQPLNHLKGAFASMLSKQRQTVACISGDAGLGKTRLVQEFLRTVNQAEVHVVSARCIALTRSRPLTVIADIVRAIAGIEESDPVAAQLSLLRTFTERFDASGEELYPYLASVLGYAEADAAVDRRVRALDDAMLRDQIHLAVRRMFIIAAGSRPLLVTLDDLHWVDTASRDCLEYVIRSSGDEPMLIVLMTRRLERATILRSLLDAAESHGGGFTDIPLEPLGQSATRILVQRIIPTDGVLEQRVRKRIIARADGNPFYVEEMVRMLAERGGLIGAPGQWRVVAGAEALLDQIPASLRGLIVTRFDGLPDELRRVLQRAAVLGRSFPVRLLKNLLDGDDVDVPASLEELEKRGFLQPEAFGLEKGYTFQHVLTQEAIHSTMLKRVRQELHRAVAEAVGEGNFWSPTDRNQALAYHWSESAEPQRAVPYLLAAAEYSARRYANTAAVDHCQRALAILGDSDPADDQRVRIQLILGRALKFLGRLSEAREVLNDAKGAWFERLSRENASVPSDVTLYVELLREFADVKAREGLLEEAASHLEEASLALAEWSDIAARDLRHAVTERMAWVRFRQGRLDEALMLAHELASTLSGESDGEADPAVLASVYNTLGGVLWQYGKLEAAAGYVRRSLALYHKIGYLFGKANAHTNLGVLSYAQGKWTEAADSFERSDWIRRETGCMVGRAGNLKNLALLRTAIGDHERARSDFQASIRASRQLGEDLETLHALLGLTHLVLIEGQYEDADELMSSIENGCSSVMGKDELAQLTWLKATAAANRGSIDQAIDMATEACRLARESGAPETEADCTRVLGALQLRAGDRETAESSLRQSLQLSQKLGDPYRQGLAMLELGLVQSSVPVDERSAEDRVLVEEAARLFTELGATHDLNRAMTALQAEKAS